MFNNPRSWIFGAATVLTAAPALATEPLLAPDDLAALLGDENVVIIDVRGEPSEGSAEIYAEGHIPGAIYAPFSDEHWRATIDGVQKLLPPVPQIEAYIRSLGIDDDDNVVLVHSGIPGSAHDFGSAARVYWTFKVLGHDAVSILDGGVAGWEDAGRRLATSATEPDAPGDFTAKFDRSIYASTADVAAAIGGPVALLDSRDHEAFVGGKQTPYVAAAGTIPTSVNVDADTMLDGVKMAGSDSLRLIFAAAGADAEAPAITFCDSGHLSAVSWFAQYEIVGNKQVRLYDGGMTEWTMDGNRPVTVGGGAAN